MKTIGLLNASIRLFAVLLLAAATPTLADTGGVEDIRGVTLSTHRGGRELGEPGVLAPSLRSIRKTGATWIAYHPYARIQKDGTVSSRFQNGSEIPAHWTEPIKAAHAQG